MSDPFFITTTGGKIVNIDVEQVDCFQHVIGHGVCCRIKPLPHAPYGRVHWLLDSSDFQESRQYMDKLAECLDDLGVLFSCEPRK